MFRIFEFSTVVSICYNWKASYSSPFEHKLPSSLKQSVRDPRGLSSKEKGFCWSKFLPFFVLPLLFLTSVALGGCTTSSLLHLPIREGVFCKRAKECERPKKVRLQVHIEPTIPKRLGTQFLFLVLPFGGTVQGELEALTFNTTFEELTLAGYEVLLGPSDSAVPALQVRLVVRELAITTYDLLFTRRVNVSGVILLGSESPDKTSPLKIPLRHSFTSRSPGSERISRGYQQALRTALRAALEKEFGHLYQRAVE